MRVNDHADGTYYVEDADRAAVDFADRADALAMNRRLIARRRQADPQSDQLAAWVEFGKHNWMWQMFHRKPAPAREVTS